MSPDESPETPETTWSFRHLSNSTAASGGTFLAGHQPTLESKSWNPEILLEQCSYPPLFNTSVSTTTKNKYVDQLGNLHDPSHIASLLSSLDVVATVPTVPTVPGGIRQSQLKSGSSIGHQPSNGEVQGECIFGALDEGIAPLGVT